MKPQLIPMEPKFHVQRGSLKGPTVTARFGDEVYGEISKVSKAKNISRPEFIRQCVEFALTHMALGRDE